MAARFEDLLNAICSEVRLSHANESQKIFLLNDAKEAQLARDVLVAHGFDAKVYTEDNASRFYITLPPADPAMEQKLAAALAYAASLKHIKQNLDTLYYDNAPALQSPDYSIMFASMPHSGKQIIIQFAPAMPSTTQSSDLPSAGLPTSRNASKHAKAKLHSDSNADEAFFHDYNPLVGESFFTHKKGVRKSKPNSIWKEIYNYIYGNTEAVIYGIVMGVVFLIILFTMFTFFRGFICPDFASSKKNHAWYCQN